MKKLFMIFLIMSFTVLLVPPMCKCESIHGIIESASADTDTFGYSNDTAFNDDNSEPEKSIGFSAKSYFAVQIGLYLNQEDADNQIINLKAMGLDSYIFQSINSKEQTVFAVRIGKYRSYKSAANKSANLKGILNKSLLITYYDSLNPAKPVKTIAKTEKVLPKPENIVVSSSKIDIEDTYKKPTDSIDVEPPGASLYPKTDKTKPYMETVDLIAEPSTSISIQEKIKELEAAIIELQDESDIRSQLTITEDEAKAEEEDILEAAGREYTLTRAGTLKLSYGLSYSYSGYDAIRESTRVEDVADHTIVNSFRVSYGLKDNLSLGVAIPFVYKYHKVGTIESLDTTDFGNLALSWQFQPFKSNRDLPSIILNGSFSIPVGRNPYEIQVGKELSTSSGIYTANFGASLSQVSDPVVAFGSLSFSYPFAVQSINQKRAEGTLDEVDPGMGVGASVGLGYALSYKLNLNLSFSYSYSLGTTYKYKNARRAKSGTSTGASMGIGTGYKLSRTQNLNFSIGIPITSSRSFSLSFSTPINFAL